MLKCLCATNELIYCGAGIKKLLCCVRIVGKKSISTTANELALTKASVVNVMDSSDQEHVKVKEGKAEILFPTANSVFYNPVQEFNRDVTIAVVTEFVKDQLRKKGVEAVEFEKGETAVINVSEEAAEQKTTVYPGQKYQDGISVLEALSATGLRSIRFAKEIPGIKRIVANDLSQDAYESIKSNILHNGVEDVVEPNVDDATIYMYQHRGKGKEFDVIDVDPYGSASIFLDAAVQAIKPGGLLCVTCTDMAVLAGHFPEAGWAKYQSISLKTKACHEQALRILLGSISSHASRYSRYIEPLVSISIDFYVRVFLRVHYGPSKVKAAASKQIYLYNCVGCGSFHTQNLLDTKQKGTNNLYYAAVGPTVEKNCSECKHKHKIGGPYWGAPLYDAEFVKRLLSSVKSFPERFGSSSRITGILTMIDQELHDVPFYYVPDELSQVIRCNSPPSKILRSAILNAGYRVSGFHGKVNAVKTNAPPSVLWDIMRKWAETQNIKRSKLKDDSPAKAILDKPISNENIDLTLHPDGELPTQFKDVTRFPNLPPNWGPKARAKLKTSDGSIEISESLKEKSERFQGKRKRKNNNEKSDKRPKSDEVLQ